MATANFLGVYSDIPAGRRPGSGAARKRYWFVWDNLHGAYLVQLLNAAYQPVGEPQSIFKEELAQRYRPEPTIYVTPLIKPEVPDPPGEKKSDIAASLRDGLKRDEDERRIADAAKVDQVLRDEFATALAKLRRGDKASAVNALERLASRREGIITAHKHTFTDFAVNLRKNRLPAVAFKFYQRALELSPEDSNAYFNMARIMFDLGDYEGTEKHLQQALNLDIDFDYARQFLEFLARYRRRGKPGRTTKDRLEPLEFV